MAATAIRLSAIGPVMIFAGKAKSIPTLANAVLLGLGAEPQDHPWPEIQWAVFSATCNEELPQNAIELQAARKGVICHSNRLTPQVRIAVEHLMRSYPPKVIIATTTLAQGVNVGISTVVIASPYISNKPITKRDFWNICGRAGRAFVDGEGKILYAIDETEEAWKVKKNHSLATGYFSKDSMEKVRSGLLYVLRYLKRIASEVGLDFDAFIELVSENDFSILGEENLGKVQYLCDLLDDELLAIQIESGDRPAAETSTLSTVIDDAFRNCLAAIQAEAFEMTPDNVIGFLKARATAIANRIPDPGKRKVLVASGLPLSLAIRTLEHIEYFKTIANQFRDPNSLGDPLPHAVHAIEEWARVHASSIVKSIGEEDVLNSIREKWLSGIGLGVLCNGDESLHSICKNFYGYELPWLLNAASQQLRLLEDVENADTLSQVSLLLEIGVPSELAARIFLAGIRSRASATEIASLDVEFGETIKIVGLQLKDRHFVSQIAPLLSQESNQWLALLNPPIEAHHNVAPNFLPFTLKNYQGDETLFPRLFQGRVYLCNVSFGIKYPITPVAKFPFERVANDPRFAFKKAGKSWRLEVRDLRISE